MQWAQAIHDIAKYFLTGTYEKAFSLEGLTNADTSLIEWDMSLPITVETRLSNGAWVPATSGSPITDATGTGDIVAQFNALLATMKLKGLMED